MPMGAAFGLLWGGWLGCAGATPQAEVPDGQPDDGAAPAADVLAVAASGEAGAYDFDVTVQSDETGCDRYADWWEVLGADGTLIFRRILDHSHPDEQPFTRGGGPVAVDADQSLVVRAHLHPTGYGGAVMSGSVASGFQAAATPDTGFGAGVAALPPQPEACLF